jgi:hypothetical protein
MGTWELVDKPLDVTPIPNKWVFTKKRDKAGHVVKYKAALSRKDVPNVQDMIMLKHFHQLCAWKLFAPY